LVEVTEIDQPSIDVDRTTASDPRLDAATIDDVFAD
jgi:hypothetical protein